MNEAIDSLYYEIPRMIGSTRKTIIVQHTNNLIYDSKAYTKLINYSNNAGKYLVIKLHDRSDGDHQL